MDEKEIRERSTLVRDHEYNMGITGEQNRFNSLEELRTYLDKVFIPNNVAYKYRKNKYQEEERYLSIQLKRIIKLKCSDEEINYIIEYLNERNIRVCGRENILEGEYENYDYFLKFNFPEYPEAMDGEMQTKLFKELQMYKSTNDPKKNIIIKKLAEGSLRLIPYITYKYALTTGYDINILNSYGCEGLIKAIEKYDPSHGAKFSTFAVIYIKNTVRNGIREIRGFDYGKEFYSDFLKCKSIVEKSYSEDLGYDITIYDEPAMIEDIIKLMKETCGLSPLREKYFRNKLYLTYSTSYEEETSALSQEKSPEENIAKKEQIIAVREALSFLSEREQEIIRLRFGFDNERLMTLEEIGNIYGISKERVRMIEKKAFERLKHPKRIKKLKEHYFN